MSNIYFFRGKAATGKTTITNSLSEELNISVLRKDVIFDSIASKIQDNQTNNEITYSILANLINTNIYNNCDIIIDVGLHNTDNLQVFLDKTDYHLSNIYYFFCDCSDEEIWNNRLKERLKNPLPNQFFTCLEEISHYYQQQDAKLMPNEIIIDSIEDICGIIKNIKSVINYTL